MAVEYRCGGAGCHFVTLDETAIGVHGAVCPARASWGRWCLFLAVTLVAVLLGSAVLAESMNCIATTSDGLIAWAQETPDGLACLSEAERAPVGPPPEGVTYVRCSGPTPDTYRWCFAKNIVSTQRGPTDCRQVIRRALEAAQRYVRDPDDPTFALRTERAVICTASCQLERRKQEIEEQKAAVKLIADALGCLP